MELGGGSGCNGFPLLPLTGGWLCYGSKKLKKSGRPFEYSSQISTSSSVFLQDSKRRSTVPGYSRKTAAKTNLRASEDFRKHTITNQFSVRVLSEGVLRPVIGPSI